MTAYGKKIFIAATAIAAVLLTAIYMNSPMEADDYWFLEGTHGMKNGVDKFLVACNTMTERWHTDTGRLGNLINPLFLALLPKWVFDVISGLMFFVTVIFSCRMASVRLGSVGSYLLLAGIVFCFPWYDYLFCVTFGINYVWAMALILMASYYLLQPTGRGWPTVIVCVLCFCAGWFHEGFGAPLSCAAVVVAVLRYRRHCLDKSFMAKVISLCAGTLMICVSPSFWNRAESQISNIVKFPFKELVMQIGPSVLIFAMFVIALIIALSVANYRHRLHHTDRGYERTIFFTVFVTAAMVVMLKYYNGPRTAAAVIMFGMVGTVWLLNRCVKSFRHLWIGNALKVLLSLAVFANLGYAANAQRKILAEYDEVVTQFQASRDGTIYLDITYPTADLSMFKTTVRQFHERIPKKMISHYMDPDKNMVILPKMLKGVGESDLKPASRPGFYVSRGYIMCEPSAAPESYQITVRDAGGNDIATRYRLDPFRLDSGKELVFVMPHIQTLDPEIKIMDVEP